MANNQKQLKIKMENQKKAIDAELFKLEQELEEEHQKEIEQIKK